MTYFKGKNEVVWEVSGQLLQAPAAKCGSGGCKIGVFGGVKVMVLEGSRSVYD